LKRDTSTETVFAYLDADDQHEHIGIVSNNHFDEDGLFSMFALCDPELALKYRGMLEAAAHAGDFGTTTDRDALRLFFVVEAFADAKVSPLPDEMFSQCEPRLTADLYTHMLQRLPGLLEGLDGCSTYWGDDEAFLETSEALFAATKVSIEEIPPVDLAIIRVPDNLPQHSFRRYTGSEQSAVHPFSVHRRTRCNRLLWLQGKRYVFNVRYESWVQLVSRRPALRVEMNHLVERLNSLESAHGIWVSEPVTDVCPRVYLDGAAESSIGRQAVIDEIVNHLRDAPVAWDPYDWSSA